MTRRLKRNLYEDDVVMNGVSSLTSVCEGKGSIQYLEKTKEARRVQRRS